MYDKYGKNGPEAGGEGDLINMIFGGGRRQGGKK